MQNVEYRAQNILISPLNWGLGHASRCVALVRQEIEAGNHVTLAGDGESLSLLRKHFPDLPIIHLPHLNLQYSAGKSQIGAMLRAIPKIVIWSIQDHRFLKQILQYQHFDKVISDNRFGLFSRRRTKEKGQRTKNQGQKTTQCIYITHQMMVKMPRGFGWAEGIVRRLHRGVIRKYDECWIPDYAGEENLSGDLSHKYSLPKNARFIGPLSRFKGIKDEGQRRKDEGWKIVAVLSGLEPQRSIFEREIMERYKNEELLIVRGKVTEAFCKIQRGKMTVVPYLSDDELAAALLGAEKIIARSGYSTIMDLHALGVLDKAVLIATPGQTEQEYLAEWLTQRK